MALIFYYTKVTVLIVKGDYFLFQVMIRVQFRGKVLKISTDSSKPLCSIKETIKSAWHVPLEQQDLYSDKLKLPDDDATTIWRAALANRRVSDKLSVLKALEKKNSKIGTSLSK